MAGVAVPSLSMTKAKLKVVQGGSGELEFQFNPTKYTVTRSASWTHAPKSAGITDTAAQYVGESSPAEIKIDDILFDAFEKKIGDVSPDVKKLLDWTKPTADSISKKKPQPPILAFDWGGNPAIDEFKGYLESVTATYTMFNKSGKPIRAKCSISLKSVTKLGKKSQNPTSGSLESRRSHLLVQGESLHSIAYAEYGLASYWRALAVFNDIDDPMRLRPGSRILLPTAEEAANLS
jgi:nucleoid-associated protein YgaU